MSENIEEQLERLGQLVDRLNNLQMALTMPLTAKLHLECVKPIIPELKEEVKDIYFKLGGENVWD